MCTINANTFITWYMDRGTVVEIFRKEVGIQCGTHENYL